MARIKNLQPWLDYFEMLQRYTEEGFLEVTAEKHEAYITRAALFTVAGYDEDPESLADRSLEAMVRRFKSMVSAMRNIRTYAAWLSREGNDYLKRPFVIHAVDDSASTNHEPRFTVVITPRRRWRTLWIRQDSIEVISYDGKEE